MINSWFQGLIFLMYSLKLSLLHKLWRSLAYLLWSDRHKSAKISQVASFFFSLPLSTSLCTLSHLVWWEMKGTQAFLLSHLISAPMAQQLWKVSRSPFSCLLLRFAIELREKDHRSVHTNTIYANTISDAFCHPVGMVHTCVLKEARVRAPFTVSLDFFMAAGLSKFDGDPGSPQLLRGVPYSLVRIEPPSSRPITTYGNY